MDILNVNPAQYADLFNMDSSKESQAGTNPLSGFSSVEQPVDLFETQKVEETKIEEKEEEQKVEEVQEEKKEEVDILSVTDKKDGPGRPSKYDFSDMSGYFEDRIKNGKFVAVEEEVNGEKKLFIPKTPEEFDEVLELQVEYKLEEAKKELEQKWYQDKSPAWQAVAKYAEMVDDPTEIAPFINGIQTIQSIANINEKEIEGAETLLRYNLQQRGIDAELIDTQIESLKTTDKLISTAEKLKPQMLQQEQTRLAQMQQEQQKQLESYYSMVNDIRENAIKAIEAPFYGSAKLTKDEKALVYDLIAQPSPETKGYQIYNAIDELFEKKDFETLKQVALLLGKKDSFFTYVGAKAAQETSAGLQRKLRVATDSRSSSAGATEEPNKNVVQRNQYANKGTVRFGRG